MRSQNEAVHIDDEQENTRGLINYMYIKDYII